MTQLALNLEARAVGSLMPPASALQPPAATLPLPGSENHEGLTWEEWYAGTARRRAPTPDEERELREAWADGGDPTEYHPSLCDRLMAGLEQANRRAEEDVQHLRALHAELLGCPVEELDQRLAAEKAEEDRMRQEVRAAAPARATKGKAAKGGDAIGIGRAALSERQRELLALVEVRDNVAVYTGTDRIPDWELLKRIMVALGGSWKTGGKKAPGGFRFPDDLDAAEIVRLAKETGEILDARAAEFFATPPALARLLVHRAEIRPGAHVLEPSAGRGAIALVAQAAGAIVRCVEPFPANARALEAHGFSVIEKDFLSLEKPDLLFNSVVMNPPFSKRQDVQHVMHAYKFLAPGGVLVAIMSAGVKYRDDKLGNEFRAFVERNRGEIWDNPDGSFEESGTSVRTVMVRVRRPA